MCRLLSSVLEDAKTPKITLCFIFGQRVKMQMWMISPLIGCPSVRGGGPRSGEEAQASISGQRM